jgi:hypothetical protein
VGDAENDNAMLQIAECSAAVANALPSVKEQASFVTTADHGAGVTELIEHLLNNDLADADKNLRKHYLQLGKAKSGEEFTISPYRAGMLLVGSSGGGKSTLTAAFLENLIASKYQFCLVDPEGDYLDFPDTVIVGDSEHEPVIEELMMLLENPQQNVVVCTLSVPLDRRPEFFNSFLARIMELRKRKAHPHWLVFDEANHMLPAEKEKSFFNLPDDLQNFLLITANPGHLNTAILKHISTVIIVGDHVLDTLKKYADPQSLSLDEVEVPELDKGEALVWDHQQSDQPTLITYSTPKHPTQRHIKKYATGKMEYNNFYFKGPGGKLNLKAYNVIIFMELAEGVDDETWMFHLKRHDYSSWFKDALHNEELADLARVVEDESKDAKSSKAQILKLVSERYTAPE